MPIIKLEWLDSEGWGSWKKKQKSLRQMKAPSLITSVGYLLVETDDYYGIVQSKSHGDYVKAVLKIYKHAVVKATYLAILLSFIMSGMALWYTFHPTDAVITNILEGTIEGYDVIIFD